MKPHDPCWRRRLNQKAMASLEALLVLPFLVLILALVIDAGHGLVTRLRADGAVRLWATSNVRLEHQPTAALVRRSYFADATTLQLSGNASHAVSGLVEIDQEIPGGLLLFVDWDDNWQTFSLSAGRGAPIGNLLPRRLASAELTLSTDTWTFNELPLTLATTAGEDGLLAQASRGAGGIGQVIAPLLTLGSPVFEGFYWLLGMEPGHS